MFVHLHLATSMVKRNISVKMTCGDYLREQYAGLGNHNSINSVIIMAGVWPEFC